MNDVISKSKGWKAIFTLIELLITISIIAILASMLLPALNKARSYAKSIKCTGNTKQIGLAQLQYISDNNEIFPYFVDQTNGGTIGNNSYASSWATLYAPYLSLSDQKARNPDYTTPLTCPSLRKLVGGHYNITYGYNGVALGLECGITVKSDWGKTILYPRKITHLKATSKQMTHTDSLYDRSSMDGLNKGRFYLCGSSTMPTCIAYRHMRKANALYADGHVSPDEQRFLSLGHPRSYPWNIANENLDWWAYGTPFPMPESD